MRLPAPKRSAAATGLRRSAFTLIELLTVIAVMVILVALLLPVLSRAKDAARRTTDISALRQVGIASVNYAADNQGWFPWRGDSWFPANLRDSVKNAAPAPDLNYSFVNPYVGDREHLMFCNSCDFCPGGYRGEPLGEALIGPEGDGNDHPDYNYMGRFYYNWQAGSPSSWLVTPPDLRRSDKNAAYPLWGCVAWKNGKDGVTGWVGHGRFWDPWPPDGGCYVYVDGHAGWKPWGQYQQFGQWLPSANDWHHYFWPGPDL